MRRERPFGLGARVMAAVLLVAAFASALTFALARTGLAPLWIALSVAALVAPLGAVAAGVAASPVARRFRALHGGLLSFTERDFSVRLAPGARDLLGASMAQFNALGEALRAERSDVFQKERMLDTVLGAAPMAVLLVGGDGRIVYSNGGARAHFARGRSVEGEELAAVLGSQPTEMRAAIEGEQDVLVTYERGGERETLHVATRHFDLRAEAHTLVLIKPLTREVTRREVLAYKNAVRVISHELNNSLAPISSLVHSGRRLASLHPESERLGRVFETVEERVTHLGRFLENYARLAKLPPPDPRPADWKEFVEGVRALHGVRLRGACPDAPGTFDPAQMQQVVANLVKNAVEAGSPADAIELEIVPLGASGFELWVRDRGAGMTDEVLAQTSVPLFSTKPAGSGLGLALCREIVEAHGGELSLHRRDGGGIAVCCALPAPAGPPPSRRG